MILKGAPQARAFGSELTRLLNTGSIKTASGTLAPYLNDKNPFRLLDLVGKETAACQTKVLLPFLAQTAETRFEGAWVVIASALCHHAQIDKKTALCLCRSYIIQGDTWYAADIFGERVPGPFLLREFAQTLAALDRWRFDANAWVRRTAGVAVHLWAKKTRGNPDCRERAHDLFEFLSPIFEEQDVRAAKGIGWGLKTLGRYYPDTAFAWLLENLIVRQRKPLAVVRRKALTYLPAHLKEKLT